MDGVPLLIPSYFHFATKKVLDRLKAWRKVHNMQFTETLVMVQHLVVGMPSRLQTTQIAILIHTQTFMAAATLFQVECKAAHQSWLGLTTLHLMRWRCSILAESREVETKNKLITVHTNCL